MNEPLNRHERRRLAATKAKTYVRQSYVADSAQIGQTLLDAGLIRSGTVSMLNVLHDDDCPALRGGYCECQPDYVADLHDDRKVAIKMTD